MNTVIFFIGLSFFSVLVNPLGWHMFIHTAPFYVPIVFKSLQSHRKGLSFPLFSFTLFCFFTLFSLLFISSGDGSLYKVARYFYELLIMWAILSNRQVRVYHINKLLRFYVYSCVAIAFQMLIQRVNIENHPDRFTIMFFKLMDPNFLSAIFVMPALVLFHKIVNKDATRYTYLFLL